MCFLVWNCFKLFVLEYILVCFLFERFRAVMFLMLNIEENDKLCQEISELSKLSEKCELLCN